VTYEMGNAAEPDYEFGNSVKAAYSQARATNPYSTARAGAGSTRRGSATFQQRPPARASAGSSASSRRGSATFQPKAYSMASAEAKSIRRGSHSVAAFSNPFFNEMGESPEEPEPATVRPTSYHQAVGLPSDGLYAAAPEEGALRVRSGSYHLANSEEPEFVEESPAARGAIKPSVRVTGNHYAADADDV
jgi:hypothetical protein